LEFEKKSILFEYLDKLMDKENKSMESCLIILYISKENDIYKSLELLKYKKSLYLPSSKEKLSINNGNDIEVILSDSPGV